MITNRFGSRSPRSNLEIIAPSGLPATLPNRLAISTNNATDPEHFVFPWQGGKGIVDPSRPMAGWRTAWRSILKEAGIKARFHDLRHTAVTTMAEAGLPDLTIMAQVGHVSPAMVKHYSHIRRQALNQCAAALQPNFTGTPKTVEMVN